MQLVDDMLKKPLLRTAQHNLSTEHRESGSNGTTSPSASPCLSMSSGIVFPEKQDIILAGFSNDDRGRLLLEASLYKTFIYRTPPGSCVLQGFLSCFKRSSRCRLAPKIPWSSCFTLAFDTLDKVSGNVWVTHEKDVANPSPVSSYGFFFYLLVDLFWGIGFTRYCTIQTIKVWRF